MLTSRPRPCGPAIPTSDGRRMSPTSRDCFGTLDLVSIKKNNYQQQIEVNVSARRILRGPTLLWHQADLSASGEG